MKGYYSRLFFCLVFSFLQLGFNSMSAQNIADASRLSPYTLVYRITDDEAARIMLKDYSDVETYFYNKVDSFPSLDENRKSDYPPGHYLLTFANGIRQNIQMESYYDFHPVLINDNKHLGIRVYDAEGKAISDALVRLGRRKLKFDEEREMFIDRKSNFEGIARIEHKGQTGFLRIERQRNNPLIWRSTKIFLNETPVRYIWNPVRSVVLFPVDLAKSIVYGYRQGQVLRLTDFFTKSYQRVVCFFDSYDGDCSIVEYQFTNKHLGYIVFDKPKYRPDETVRLKSFIYKKNVKTIKDSVKVVLVNERKDLFLGYASQYSDGGFTFEFQIHDSLDLKLNRRYAIEFQNDKERVYLRSWFQYEDYELKGINMVTETNSTDHHRGQPFSIKISGYDSNNLPLYNSRAIVEVFPMLVAPIQERFIFMPDTIWKFESIIANPLDFHVFIPDSVFPQTGFTYRIKTTLLSSDNERIEDEKIIEYKPVDQQFAIEQIGDSLQFTYIENGVSVDAMAEITAYDWFGNPNQVYDGDANAIIKIDPIYSKYAISNEHIRNEIDLGSTTPPFYVTANRSKNQIHVRVNNTFNLPFTYQIYKVNRLVEHSATQQLDTIFSARGKKDYFLTIQYLWGGRIRNSNLRIPYHTNNLNLEVVQPQRIFPGQQTQIEVRVTDTDNQPVEGVDVTAQSLTSKFQYSPPSLPILHHRSNSQRFINDFSLNKNQIKPSFHINQDYNDLKNLFGIDTMAYYRFLFPDPVSEFRVMTTDSVTQFAPYVMKDGTPQKIHVILVDNSPVYFSWTNQIQRWSFPVVGGNHQIKLRLTDSEITIDSLNFDEGIKTIFSIKADHSDSKIKVRSFRNNKLLEEEKNKYYPYLFGYTPFYATLNAFVRSNITFLQLSNMHAGAFYNPLKVAGPVAGNLRFYSPGFYSLPPFQHQPLFQYDFQNGLVIMKDIDKDELFPDRLNRARPITNLDQFALGINDLFKATESANRSRLNSYYYNLPAINDSTATCRVSIQFGSSDVFPAENIILINKKNPDFFRLLRGNQRGIRYLHEADYSAILLFSNNRYCIVEDLSVRKGGMNYWKISAPDSLFSLEPYQDYGELLVQLTGNDHYSTYLSLSHIKKVEAAPSSALDGAISGRVVDESGQNPMPGVIVSVKGGSSGTLTDMHGYFRLKVNDLREMVNFNFIGYQTIGLYPELDDFSVVVMKPDQYMLDEVVVIGYGRQSRRYSDEIFSVSSDLAVGTLQGHVAGIQIRGISSGQNENLLYVIDGVVFTGNPSDIDVGRYSGITILKPEEATAIYGARASNGVILLSSNADSNSGPLNSELSANQPPLHSFNNSVRNNFSDVGFWQPSNTTGSDGKVLLDVTFPDDITRWDTHYYAANTSGNSGRYSSSIASYLPLTAKLPVPAFFTVNDSVNLVGNVVNYSADTLQVSSRFSVDNSILGEAESLLEKSLVEELIFQVPDKDSVNVEYIITTQNGYLDGENHTVNIRQPGINERVGDFIKLEGDTTFQLNLDSEMGAVTITAHATELDLLLKEIDDIVAFPYNCNEQMASKLNALLAKKRITQFRNETFTDDREVEKYIRLLLRNQNSDGLWGWWSEGQTDFYVSDYVFDALQRAKDAGYDMNIRKQINSERLIFLLDNSSGFSVKFKILGLLWKNEVVADYTRYLNELRSFEKLSVHQNLQFQHLLLMMGENKNISYLDSLISRTAIGNAYIASDGNKVSLWDNRITNTILALRISEKSGGSVELTNDFRSFLLESRTTGYWRNTMEKAEIITAVTDGLVIGSIENEPDLSLEIVGDSVIKTDDFPFYLTIDTHLPIEIIKRGHETLYFSYHQDFFNKSPEKTVGDLEIETLVGESIDKLVTVTSGDVLNIQANVTIHSEAEYVMIRIPLPAGFSYHDVQKTNSFEEHREYFRHELVIFCSNLPEGDHSFNVSVVPRFRGVYQMNPARIELMYFPIVNAHEKLKSVVVE